MIITQDEAPPAAAQQPMQRCRWNHEGGTCTCPGWQAEGGSTTRGGTVVEFCGRCGHHASWHQPPPTDIEIMVGTRLRHPSGLVTRVVRIEDGWVYYDDLWGSRVRLTRLQELVRAGGTQVL